MTVKQMKNKQLGRPVGSKKPIPENVKKDVGNLQDPASVRILVQRLANHCMRNEISTLQTSALNGLLLTWIKLFELSSIEKRLDDLERKIDKSIKKGGVF